MNSTTEAIAMRGVTKSYGATRAIDGIGLTIAAGSSLALLGPNGAGKTTLIGMMVGLVRPDAGTVQVAGRSAAEAVASGRIAAMLQDAGLMPGVRVGELVRLGAALYPDPFAVDAVLELAGITDLAARRVDRLSGGQAQRVRFALAIVGRPDILVLDEPTRALDVEGRAAFWAGIRAYSDTGRTVLFSTHYLEEVEGNADRVIVLARGAVVADGTPREVRASAGVSRVRFRLPDGVQPDGPLAHTQLVLAAERHGSVLEVSTADSDEVVRRLLASGIPWSSLEVSPPDLDDSYLHLTRAVPARETVAAATNQE